MKTKKISSIVLLGFFAAGITFSACKKSYTPASSASNLALESESMKSTNNVVGFDSSANEDFDVVMSDEASSSNARNTVCYTVTYAPSKDVFPHTKTLDYGSGCTNTDGVTKKGKVIVTYYDPAVTGGKFSVTNYNNYYVNNVHIEGSVQINESTNASGQTIFTHIANKTITSPDGDFKDWNSNLVFTLIEGQNTTKKLDDVYQITGSAHGKETLDGVEANNWKSDVDKNNVVIKPQTCNRRVKGGLIVTIHLKEKGKADRQLDEYLDYGNGDCDDIATLTIDGVSQQVTLPLQFWPLHQY
jgi:hypothetical protein